MTCNPNSGRYTSKDLLVQYLPCGVAQTHIQKLRFNSGNSAGTFKLRVNGEETAAITYSSTASTLISNINSALDALDALAAGEIVATGTDVTDITLTSTASQYYVIQISDDSLTGNTSADPNVTTEVTQQGSKLYTISSQVSAFSYEETVDTVDMTAISEFEATMIPVKSTMTFDLTVFDAPEDWRLAFQAGKRGIMYVYPQGKVSGREYFAFWALIESGNTDFPDHEKVERQITGSRQGAMVVPFHSVYKV